jgi:hypothetical protein
MSFLSRIQSQNHSRWRTTRRNRCVLEICYHQLSTCPETHLIILKPIISSKRARIIPGLVANQVPGHSEPIHAEGAPQPEVPVVGGTSVRVQDAGGSTGNVPVSQLVELIFQRMQQAQGPGHAEAQAEAYPPAYTPRIQE